MSAPPCVRSVIAILALALPSTACDVEWGGASVALINPAPEPEPATEAAGPEIERVEPLPAGDLLYLVRFTAPGGGDGSVAAVAIARMEGSTPAALGLPEGLDEEYRARFDSAFYAAGTELPLHAGGHRIGTLVFDGSVRGGSAACLSVATGRALLLPDTEPPEFAFALASDGVAGRPVTYDLTETDNRMRTFGPVLAENLFRRGGESRPYLAQRASMRPVPWPGDDRPAMTATYLVNDALGGEPPSSAASSLFFLARFDGSQYVPEWWEVRRYRGAEDREAFVYFGALDGPDGRVDFTTRHDGGPLRLAASVDRDDGDRSVDWTESARCPGVGLLAPAGG